MIAIAQGLPRVDVIVRTLADNARESQLFHALDSIQSQQGVSAQPIVVVNGERRNESTMVALRARPGIRLHHFPEASAGLAITKGRELVDAPYFMFLDDDDQLVPHALDEIVPHAEDDVDWDVLITNGRRRAPNNVCLLHEDLMSLGRNPLHGLLRENWLSPGTSLFRTASVSVELLDVGRSYHEWTHIAFRLVLTGKEIKFHDVMTAVINDSPKSLSKSLEYHEEGINLLGALRAHPGLDAEVRAALDNKYHNALHTLAAQYARVGAMRKAWRCHCSSLRPPHTFKYLLFSRKLLFPKRYIR